MAGSSDSLQVDDAQEPSEVYFGSLRAKVVGLRYYNGVVSRGEACIVQRQPQNQYDRNACKVSNLVGQQVGHIARDNAADMAPMMDHRQVRVEASVPFGKTGAYEMPIDLHFFGPEASAVHVQKFLRVRNGFINFDFAYVIGHPRGWENLKSNTPSACSSSSMYTGTGSGIRAADVLEKHMDKLFVDPTPYEEMPLAKQPADLKTELYPHQLKALQWMVERERPLTVGKALAAMAKAREDKAKAGAAGAAASAGAGAGSSSSSSMSSAAAATSSSVGSTSTAASSSASSADPSAARLDVVAFRVRASASTRAFFWERTAEGQYLNVATNTVVKNPPPLPCGGILADDMGLGKTLTTIALIAHQAAEIKKANNKAVKKASASAGAGAGPSSSSAAPADSAPRKPTLIVAPLSVLEVWRSQFEEHVKTGSLSVYVHYGPDRSSNAKDIANFDVVLTTYQIVASETVLEPLERAAQASELAQINGSDHGGSGQSNYASSNLSAGRSAPGQSALQRIEWGRVILDEAHTIKNKATVQARACHCLAGDVRWCLTGTPIQNKLDDLHSLIKFLRLAPFDSADWWKRIIIRPITQEDPNGFERLASVMAHVCLRRTKTQRVGPDLQPLITLPPKHIHTVPVTLNETDRITYDGLRQAIDSAFNRLERDDSLMSSSVDILEALLRLRQIACHSLLVPASVLENALARAKRVAQMGSKGAAEFEARLGKGVNIGSSSATDGHGRAQLERMLAVLEASAGDECVICMDPVQEPVVTLCAHLFCKACVMNLLASAPAVPAGAGAGAGSSSSSSSTIGSRSCACPLCRAVIQAETLIPGDRLREILGISASASASGDADSAGAGVSVAASKSSVPVSAKVECLITMIKSLIAGSTATAAIENARKENAAAVGMSANSVKSSSAGSGAGAASSSPALDTTLSQALPASASPRGSASVAKQLDMSAQSASQLTIGAASAASSVAEDAAGPASVSESVPSVAVGKKRGRPAKVKPAATNSAAAASAASAAASNESGVIDGGKSVPSSLSAGEAGAGVLSAASAAADIASSGMIRSRSGRAIKKARYDELASGGSSDADDEPEASPASAAGDADDADYKGSGRRSASSTTGRGRGSSIGVGKKAGGRASKIGTETDVFGVPIGALTAAAAASDSSAAADLRVLATRHGTAAGMIAGQRSKSVVFSQFTGLLDIIGNRLAQEGIKFVRLDGSMSANNRAESVAAFQSNPTVHVMLVSLRSGGVGLTLTAATNVFIVDPPFNPAAQDQALDRVHRLGQTQAVNAYLLVADHSIESSILKLQERKRAMGALVIGAAKMSREEIVKMKLNDLRLLMGRD